MEDDRQPTLLRRPGVDDARVINLLEARRSRLTDAFGRYASPLLD